MTLPAKTIDEVARRALGWPENAKRELLLVAAELEAEIEQVPYRADPAELAGIDRGLQEADEGRFARADQIASVIARPTE